MDRCFLIVYLGLVLGCLAIVTECRQMCWSCQYQTNSFGPECVSAPANWTAGDPRVKCAGVCITDTRYNSKGELTYIFRGCAILNGDHKDGCTRTPTMDACTFTCGSGKEDDYCNDRDMAKSLYKEPGDGVVIVTMSWLPLVLGVTIASLPFRFA